MYGSRFRIGCLLVLGAVLVIGGCADSADEQPADGTGLTGGWSTAGCEFPRLPEHMVVAGTAMPVTPAKLEAAMDRIDRAGRGEFAGAYAGLEVDQENARAIVFRVPSAAFDDFIRQAAEDTCIVVRDAAHTAVDLAVWHDRVLADLDFWRHNGVRIVSVGARHDGAGVEIGTQDLDRARTELPARYGPDAPLLFLQEDPVRPLANPTATPRIN
ncbi:hypothetical protein C8E87_3812 [Paractinoplanes brasiliensis]|uniref:Uncharacterized protein n=1 Tax=Paractinoplanes brasiliensis TaxID=52695 RepID=A0A4R6JZ58_9ACTN|nr:hypothetical protein C8E87_3812 [Actinoplanes brasiliensis]GID25170.1 hypothetical protein Abr02nite_01530 [Actinoplanes brasiliensis]